MNAIAGSFPMGNGLSPLGQKMLDEAFGDANGNGKHPLNVAEMEYSARTPYVVLLEMWDKAQEGDADSIELTELFNTIVTDREAVHLAFSGVFGDEAPGDVVAVLDGVIGGMQPMDLLRDLPQDQVKSILQMAQIAGPAPLPGGKRSNESAGGPGGFKTTIAVVLLLVALTALLLSMNKNKNAVAVQPAEPQAISEVAPQASVTFPAVAVPTGSPTPLPPTVTPLPTLTATNHPTYIPTPTATSTAVPTETATQVPPTPTIEPTEVPLVGAEGVNINVLDTMLNELGNPAYEVVRYEGMNRIYFCEGDEGQLFGWGTNSYSGYSLALTAKGLTPEALGQVLADQGFDSSDYTIVPGLGVILKPSGPMNIFVPKYPSTVGFYLVYIGNQQNATAFLEWLGQETGNEYPAALN